MSQLTMTATNAARAARGDDNEPSLIDRYGQLVATALCGVTLLLGWLLNRVGVIGDAVALGFYAAAYLFGGARATRQAIAGLLARTLDIDLLMVTAAAGAAVIGHWTEGGILLFLFSLGNALEHYAMGRTHSAVRALMDLSPDDALVVRDGVERRLLVSELLLGDAVIVKPGERIPADGQIERGASDINQAAITGESMPVGRGPGEPVFAGSINGQGALTVRVTRLAHESTLARIIAIVQAAQAQKSATQRFTDRFEGRYAGGVISAAALYALLPWALLGHDFGASFYRAMILLVVASPCALVISTPAATLSALANAARHGILFKGAGALEDIGGVNAIAFDKTGTLTIGQPRLTDVRPLDGVADDELLALAAAVERHSEHPLAEAVLRGARAAGIEPPEADDLTALVGRGVSARVGGREVLVGNERLLAERGVALDPAARAAADELRDGGKTTMYVAEATPDGARVLGVIGVADTVRPIAATVIGALRATGVEQLVMLTGDNERAARAIARQAGISDFRAALLPEQKVEAVTALAREHGSVAMIGDGVNDAPALASATVGIAMGAAGSDVALETADVVLMADDLTRLPYAIELSRRSRRVIRQNLGFALLVITLLATGTLLGLTTLPIGVVGHEGSTIVVVLNGLRLLGGGGGASRAGAAPAGGM